MKQTTGHLEIVGLVMVASLLTSGCGNNTVQLEDRMHQQEQRMARLEARLTEAENLRRSEYYQLSEKLAKSDENRARAGENRRTLDQLTIQLSEAYRTIDELAKSMKKMSTEMAALKQKLNAQASAQRPPAESGNHNQSANDQPFIISNISGEKIITGTHASTRPVPTDEFERDAMGNKTRVMKQEEIQVNEYGYQVRFDIQNLTQRLREVQVSAGPTTRRIQVPAGGVVSNATVPSVMGSELTITEGSRSWRYPVEYEGK
jgi:chromosome segregation ATPase